MLRTFIDGEKAEKAFTRQVDDGENVDDKKPLSHRNALSHHLSRMSAKDSFCIIGYFFVIAWECYQKMVVQVRF